MRCPARVPYLRPSSESTPAPAQRRPEPLRSGRKLLARSAQSRARGPEWDLFELGDLFDRNAFELREDEDGPELERKAQEHGVQELARLPLLEPLLGRRALVEELREVHVGQGWPSPLFAEHVRRHPHGDAIE